MTIESFETLAFYRGLSTQIEFDHPQILSTRKNRSPRNMDAEVHANADTWFERRFGIRYRSQAVFVTSSLFIATQYAYNKSVQNVVRVIPISAYKFCWSPKYSDLLSFKLNSGRVSIEEYLEAGSYIETNLKDAHATGHEVMLGCDEFIAIPCKPVEQTESNPTAVSKIILL